MGQNVQWDVQHNVHLMCNESAHRFLGQGTPKMLRGPIRCWHPRSCQPLAGNNYECAHAGPGGGSVHRLPMGRRHGELDGLGVRAEIGVRACAGSFGWLCYMDAMLGHQVVADYPNLGHKGAQVATEGIGNSSSKNVHTSAERPEGRGPPMEVGRGPPIEVGCIDSVA